MASDDYKKALKMGKAAYRRALSRGEYPYLPALDAILTQAEMKTEESLGLVNIPLDQIVGTKTEGRQNSFANNFMPLMPEYSEFARKWDGVVDYHMNQGIGDPIVCYEFMNKFYVLEGNKRVSVLKYFGVDSIEGTVTREIPYPQDTPESRIYFEFLDFYKDSQVNYIWFTQPGSFPKLTLALKKKPGEKWTDEDKENFRSLYTEFSGLFKDKGGDKLKITAGDALLFYLSLYSYKEIQEKSHSEKAKDLDRIFKELPALGDETQESLVFKPEAASGGSVLNRILHPLGGKTLRIAFIHDRRMSESGWTYGHELGRMHVEDVFGDRIQTAAYFLQDDERDIAELIDAVIQDGYEIIFTANQKFLAASLKAAIEHPEVKILNCSVGQPHNSIRTYYGRLFEAKYLAGMIAGAMTENEKIAYRANFPIYGTMAEINAFALGARMTNPRAQVYLHWDSLKDHEHLSELLDREDISVVSGNDMIRPGQEGSAYGLFIRKDGKTVNLAAPIWNWGRFYERIISDILQGSWDSGDDVKSRNAVNYWWGISSGIIDLVLSGNLPRGVRRFADVMRSRIVEEDWLLNPFAGKLFLQDGRAVGTDAGALPAQEVITMNYLLEGIVGSVPSLDELNQESRDRIAMQQIITPESVNAATAKHTPVQVVEKVIMTSEEPPKEAASEEKDA